MSASTLVVNKFGFSFGMYLQTYLPAPYATNCINFGKVNGSKYESQDECYEDCYWKLLHVACDKTSTRVTTTQMDVDDKTKDTYKRKFVSTNALQNSTLKRVVSSFAGRCTMVCNQPACWEEIYTARSLSSGPSEYLRINIYSLNAPPFITNYSAKMSFTEFTIQILSCFGIWLTIDFTSLISVFTTVHRFFKERSLK